MITTAGMTATERTLQGTGIAWQLVADKLQANLPILTGSRRADAYHALMAIRSTTGDAVQVQRITMSHAAADIVLDAVT